MPHELDVKADGSAAMFSVRQTPWHGLGAVLNEAPSLEMGMKLSGTDYDVELRPIRFTPRRPVHVPGQTPAMAEAVDVPGFRAVVRTDREHPLAVVSASYKPLQNRDVFRVLEPLLDRGVARLETGGTLREGRDAWMMVAFSVDDPVVREVFASEVVPYGLLSTNHSGSRSAVLMETPVRVVCANTLASAMGAVAGNRVNVLHRGEPGVKVVEAAERMFVRLTDRYRDIAVRFKVMKEARLDAQAFQRSVLDLMAPLPKTRPGQSETRYEQMHEKAMLRRAKLFDLWHHGDGHKGDESAWEAFNAAVQAIDHDDEMFRTRGPRVESLMVGGLGKLKARVERAVMQEARAAGW